MRGILGLVLVPCLDTDHRDRSLRLCLDRQVDSPCDLDRGVHLLEHRDEIIAVHHTVFVAISHVGQPARRIGMESGWRIWTEIPCRLHRRGHDPDSHSTLAFQLEIPATSGRASLTSGIPSLSRSAGASFRHGAYAKRTDRAIRSAGVRKVQVRHPREMLTARAML